MSYKVTPGYQVKAKLGGASLCMFRFNLRKNMIILAERLVKSWALVALTMKANKQR